MKCIFLFAAFVCVSADAGLKIDRYTATSESEFVAQEPAHVTAVASPSRTEPGNQSAPAKPTAKSVEKPAAKVMAEPPARAEWLPAKVAAPRRHSKEAIAAAGHHKAHKSHKVPAPDKSVQSQETPKTHSAEAIVEAARHKAVVEDAPQAAQATAQAAAQATVRSFGHSSYSVASAAQHKKMMDKKRRAQDQSNELSRELSHGVADALAAVLAPMEATGLVQRPGAQTAAKGADVAPQAVESEKEKERRAAIHKGAMRKARAAARRNHLEVSNKTLAEGTVSVHTSRLPAPSQKAKAKKSHKLGASHGHMHRINAALLKKAVAKK